MDGRKSDCLKSFSLSQVVTEIKRLQDLLSKYEKGDPSLPSDFNYKETIYTLRYLRMRQISWKKSKKETINE
jgi:hypothetical protein